MTSPRVFPALIRLLLDACTLADNTMDVMDLPHEMGLEIQRHPFVIEHNNGHSTKVVVTNNNATASPEELYQKVKDVFGHDESAFFLQAWDDECACFVDIKPGDRFKRGSRIRIQLAVQVVPIQVNEALVSPCSMPQSQQSQDQSNLYMGSDQLDDNEFYEASVTQYSIPQSEAQASQDQLYAESDNTDTELDGDPKLGEQQNEINVSSKGGSWHVTYTLPRFPDKIERKLQAGASDLAVAERSLLLEAIYNSVVKYTYYPTSSQYDKIIELIFQKYAALCAPRVNMPLGNMRLLWKDRLTRKFQQLRKGEKDETVKLQFRKRTASRKGEAVQEGKTTCAKPQWGLKNYLPQRPASEDDNTIRRHEIWMQEEKKKRYPDIKRVNVSMLATLSTRRNKIVKANASVAEMEELYPWLFTESQILSEMDRLMGMPDKAFFSKFKEGFRKYGSAILSYGRRLKKKSDCVEVLASKIPLQREKKDRDDAVTTAAIILLPTMFRENIHNIFKPRSTDHEQHEENDVPSPIIQCNECTISSSTNFEVIVDGAVVVTTGDLFTAFSCYVASIYTFNLINPNEIKKSLSFTQKVILGFTDDQPILKPILTVVAKLNTLLQ